MIARALEAIREVDAYRRSHQTGDPAHDAMLLDLELAFIEQVLGVQRELYGRDPS